MGGGPGDNSSGVPDGDDAAAMQNGDAVAKGVGLLDVMGGKEHGAALGAELADGVVKLAPDLGVEAGGGLVQEEQRRVIDKGERKGKALALAAGEGLEARVGFFGQREAIEEPAAGDGARIERGKEVERLARRDGVLKGGRLQDGADARA